MQKKVEVEKVLEVEAQKQEDSMHARIADRKKKRRQTKDSKALGLAVDALSAAGPSSGDAGNATLNLDKDELDESKTNNQIQYGSSLMQVESENMLNLPIDNMDKHSPRYKRQS